MVLVVLVVRSVVVAVPVAVVVVVVAACGLSPSGGSSPVGTGGTTAVLTWARGRHSPLVGGYCAVGACGGGWRL